MAKNTDKAAVEKVLWSEDGLVHLKPRGFYDPCETLCGNVNTSSPYEDTSEKVTCPLCKAEFKALKNGIAIAN